MNFKTHSQLQNSHAFLSASKYHWVNYDEEKLTKSYNNYQASQMGTRLHEFAEECIKLKIKLPKGKKTLNTYVNDAIGFKMIPEQILYYSDNCFGTADAIVFKNNLLRIHDLKTGSSRVSFNQLEIYTAMFCLEYNKKPASINVELRIYQNDEVMVHIPNPDDIIHIMDKIITFDKLIEKMKSGA